MCSNIFSKIKQISKYFQFNLIFVFIVTNLVWMLELVKLSQHCLLELVRLNSDPYSPRGNFVRVRKNKVKPNNAPYYFFRLASLKQARMKQMVTAITDWIVILSYKYSYQLWHNWYSDPKFLKKNVKMFVKRVAKNFIKKFVRRFVKRFVKKLAKKIRQEFV